MKKVISGLLVTMMILATAVGCSAPGGGTNPAPTPTPGATTPAPSAQKKIEMKLSHPAATEHPYHLGSVMLKDKVEAGTNGDISITIFPTNQLGSQQEVTEAAQLGTIDLVVTSDDQLVSIVPDFGALGMPFLFDDFDHVYNTLNGEVGDLLSKKLEAKNMIVISWMENGFRNITNNSKPITKPEDLKGLKIRTSSTKPNMELFNTYGAQATNIAFSELYTALQLKTVDAQENPFANIIDKKFFEVQKYLSVTGHVHTSEPMIMSKTSYDKLTPDNQILFKEVGKDVSKWAFDDAKKQQEAGIETLKAKGMEINEVEKQLFVDAAKPVYDKFGEQYKEILGMIKK